jgi:uncharacterized membrane protein HdeD (DUF308 family)
MTIGGGFRETLAERLGATLSDNWWVLLLRGIVAILFAIVVFARPAISLAALVIWFGLFAFVDGILTSYIAVTHKRDSDNWGMLFLSGLVGIGIGIVTWAAPGITALALLFYIAIWAIARGVLEVVAAIRLRKVIEGEWRLAFVGLLAILFGIFLIAQPSRGLLTVLWVLGLFALIDGIALIGLSFKMRSMGHQLEMHHPHAV